MGLNQRGRGRGRGGKGSFPNKGRRGGGGGAAGVGGMGNQGAMFRPGPPPPGMFGPPMGYPPEPPFRAPFFGAPPAFNFGPPRPGYGKFPRKNFKRKPIQKNESQILEIDLSKPWVTEEIKTEEAKKKEFLEVWRKSKNDEDWSKYKAQKQVVQNLYDKAKDEYVANHPEQAYLLRIYTTVKYYCETCDKSFKTDDDLFLHEAEHEVCGREGCEFSAHPKIIAKHRKVQHDSGLYKRIGKLYTEDDIKKWIEERKRRYPSRKVIEEKKALEEEKIKRGEKIKDDESKFNKDFQKNKSNRTKRFEGKTSKRVKNRRPRKKAKNRGLSLYLEEEVQTERSGIPAFRGIGNQVIEEGEKEEIEQIEEKEDDLQISDEEWEISNQVPNYTEPLINSSLKLLATCYDSDSDEDEGVVLDEKKTEVGKDSSDEDSGPEEVQTVHSRSSTALGENLSNYSNVSRKRKLDDRSETQIENNKRLREQNSQNKSEYRKVTLLEKLLKKEIRHERNIILQCVHYIVRNDFLQKTR